MLSSAWEWELVCFSLGSHLVLWLCVGMAWTVLAGLHCFWGFRCVDELEVICTRLLVLSGVACLSHSFNSGDHEWYWATPAQLTRRDIVETSMSWAGSDTGRLVAAISEEGDSACLCL